MLFTCFTFPALSRTKEDTPEFSLSEGDDIRTEQALQEAFDQETGRQQQGDPGTSPLQDSVLGLQPNGESDCDLRLGATA